MNSLATAHHTVYAYIELTSRCNLRCVYCALSHPEYHGEDFDLSRFERLVEDLKKRRTRFLLVSGHGETTIIRDWYLLCDKLIDEGFHLMLNTNLSKSLNDKEVETLTKFHVINTSCDTIDPDLFSKLRRHSKLEMVWQNIEKIQKASKESGHHPYWAWNAVVSDVSIWGLREWASEGLKRGIQNFNLFTLGNYKPLADVFDARPLRFLSNEKAGEADAIIRQTIMIIKKGGGYVYVQPSLTESLNRRQKETFPESLQDKQREKGKRHGKLMTRDCFDPWLTALIKSDGRVAPCCVHVPIAKMEENYSLDQVLQSESFLKFRTQLIEGDISEACQSCARRPRISVKKFKWKLRLYKLGAFIWLQLFWTFRKCSSRWLAKVSQRLFILLQKF